LASAEARRFARVGVHRGPIGGVTIEHARDAGEGAFGVALAGRGERGVHGLLSPVVPHAGETSLRAAADHALPLLDGANPEHQRRDDEDAGDRLHAPAANARRIAAERVQQALHRRPAPLGIDR